MAVNQLIAQGLRPIGADAPQIANMLQQMQQQKQQNALARQELGIRSQNAGAVQMNAQTAATNAQREATKEQYAYLANVGTALANAKTPEEFAMLADRVTASPQYQSIPDALPREQLTPEVVRATLPEVFARAGMQMPQAPVPFEQTADYAKLKMQGEQAAALERQRAGSAMQLERTRQAGAKTTAPAAPAGYRYKDDGSMEAVPGGPADVKLNPPKKLSDAKDVLGIIAIAEPLLNKATGSYIGTGVDKAAQAFGKSTGGSVAISQLKALQAALMLKMPRMEGPQSNLDVQLYREAAGTIGDPTVPVENKRAALGVVKQMNEKYTGGRTSGATGVWSVEEVK
jgi:hypothetical protein